MQPPKTQPARTLLALLLLALATGDANARGGGGFSSGGFSSGGFSSGGGARGGSSFSAPSASRSSTSSFAPSVSRPTSSGSGPSVSAPSGARAPGVSSTGRTSFGTFARPTRPPTAGTGSSLAVPFLLGAGGGLLLGSVISNNANGRYSQCGTSQVCYEGTCNMTLDQQCKGANSTLERVTCPSAPYTECYESLDKQFTCYGVARPTSSSSIKAECFAGNSTNTNFAQSGDPVTSGAAQKVPLVAAIFGAGLLFAVVLAV